MIQVDSLEETAREKIVALIDRARNEPRDLYDLCHVTSNQGTQLNHLNDGMCQKVDFRGRPCKDFEPAILQMEARLKALWSSRSANQVAILPEFEEAFRALRRALRQANLP